MQSAKPSTKLSKGEPHVYSSCPFYSVDQVKPKLFGLQLAACDPSVSPAQVMGEVMGPNPVQSDPESGVGSSHKPAVVTVAGGKTSCGLCSMEFESRYEQSEHFRSDWHLYNLKLKLRGILPISENEFADIVDNLSSSISGSDSDSEEDETESGSSSNNQNCVDVNRLDIGPLGVPLVPVTQQEGSTSDPCLCNDNLSFGTNGRRYPKLFLKNSDGELISVYRCILYHKKNPPTSLKSVFTTLNNIPGSMYWAVLLSGGGHFAATIFENGKVVAHKTFHRYTVRAKQGKSQGSRDSRGNAPRSAGATLRRHNESALIQDVQELLMSWTDHLKKCDLIFVRAPSYNQQMLFSGKSSPLNRNDMRIRIVPFHTRRPTHNETRRVHEMLASVECYGNECEMREFVPRSPPRHFSVDSGQFEIVTDFSQLKRNLGKSLNDKKKKNQKGKPPSGSGEAPKDEKNAKDERVDLVQKESDLSSSDDEMDGELCFVEEEISMLHLQEDEVDFGCPTADDGNSNNYDKTNKNINKSNYKPVKKGSKEKDCLKNLIYHACKSGNVSQMKDLLCWLAKNTSTPEATQEQSCKNDIDSVCQKEDQLSLITADIHTNSDDASAAMTAKLASSSRQTKDFSQSESSEISADASVKTASSNRQAETQFESKNSTNTVDAAPTTVKTEILSCLENATNFVNASETTAKTVSCSGLGETVLSSENVTNSAETILEPCVDQANSCNNPINTECDKNLQEQFLDLDFTSDLKMAADIKFPEILNERWGSDKRTLLHIVAQAGHLEIIYLLLEAGADPALCNNKGIPPYIIATKETRNEFRRFMGKYPDKYGYRKAQIPGPLTPEMEAGKKQKESLRKKAKQQRLREKKQVDEEAKIVSELKAKREEEELRYKNLSEREKRALAAERRFLNQKSCAGESKPILARCSQCFCDISGLIPYEYYHFRFCTPKCLKEHRVKSRLS